MILQTTLSLAAAAAIINFWLGIRIGRLRHELKISIGHGGNESLQRRMRAQLNFAEHVPLVLILIGLIEMTGKGGAWLAPVGAAYVLSRVFHAFGMDGGSREWGRMIGTIVNMLATLGFAVVAVLIALGRM